MAASWQEAERVLVVRLDNMGDVLVTTPAIHAIRENLPDAHIALFASKAGSQIADLDPDLDEAIVFDAPWMDVPRTLPQDPNREFEMIRLLTEKEFDGAIIFTSYHQSSLPAAYMCYMAGIPLRHAASIDFPGSLLTTRHRHPETMVHEVRRGLNLVAGIGFESSAEEMVLVPHPHDAAAAASFLEQEEYNPALPLVVIHPGCSCQARAYPWKLHAQAADLITRDLSCTVVFTGTAGEVGLVEQIRSAMSENSLSLAGRTDFRTLAGLIQVSDVVVTGNTGPMHVAAALKTPVVALFALTNPPEQWGPWNTPHRLMNHDVPCRICYSFACPADHICLAKVSPDEVKQAVRELLSEHPKHNIGRHAGRHLV